MTNVDNDDIKIEYVSTPSPHFSLIDDMWIVKGDKEDWAQLHGLHYKADGMPPGSRYWKVVTGEGYLVGIVMMSAVSLLSGPRHKVFPKLKPGNDTYYTNVHRAKWLNANMRRVARVVTDTMYRGVGISYRMVNLAARMEGFKFVEIQSSMSKFNPFDTKAGFNHAHLRTATAYASGLAFFRRYLESHPADHENVLEELRGLSDTVRPGVIKAMQEFYYKNSAKERTGSNTKTGMRKVEAMTTSDLVRELQQLIFATPVYGIYQNLDYKTKLPDRLPLTAFDWQSVKEPMNAERLCNLNENSH